MIRNYLKIAFRSLWGSKVHSFINIAGLSLGIACCMLIILFVTDEWTFDRFHTKADRIYRVFGREDWGESQDFYTSTPFPMGPALKENIPEIESQVRINNISTLVKFGERQFSETLTIAGQDFFKVFDFPIINGTREGVLEHQNNVVVSDWLAKEYFGEADPINKTISLQLGEVFEEFTVAAVVPRMPTNSSIAFYLMISDLNLPKLYSERRLTSAWFNISPETYVMLREGVAPETVTDKFPALFKKILGEEKFRESKYAPGLQPLTSIHLGTDYPVVIPPVSDPKYSHILGAIAVLILFVACINFVTLSIGRSMKRAKEVGIRKVVGAERKQLIFQFIGEAVIVTLIAMALGMALSVLNLPLFNDLSGKQLVFPLNGFMVAVVLSLLAVIGLIAGSYPAFVLSGFRPIAILKGNIRQGSSKQSLRKALVGVQLLLSIFLISSTLLMRNQLEFLQNKNLGFNKEQVAVIQINVPQTGKVSERVNKGLEKAELFRPELLKLAGVSAVCVSSHDFANGGWTDVGFTDDKGVYRTFHMNVTDDQYLPTLGMKLVQGRNFSEDNPADRKRSVIVNEAFAKAYGWADAIGKKIPGKNFPDHEVIGVVSDFNYASLYSKVEPLALVYNPAIILDGIENINVDNSPVPKLLIRLRPGDMQATIEKIGSVWAKITGGEEFMFTFVDEALAAQYRADQNLGKIVSIASLLAIVIGSLGLYGLASLAMQNRTKEISIRKVLGATVQSLLVLLSKDYVYLILVSLVLSVPVTFYLMNQWLSTFEYRITIGADVFLVAGGISLLIALVTISYQAIRTAWSQPAQTLKDE